MLGETPRAIDLAALREREHCPVLIIGGGIVGIGALRELALQGISAVLVERGDFCSGASSTSSRLLHGGLRYLENGEFRLVGEALRERDRLLANAPHAAFPLAITLPLFSRWSGLWNAPLHFLGWGGPPATRGALLVKLGLSFYDFYTRRGRRLPRHRFVNRRESLQQRPALNPDIRATAIYYDARMSQPERIALDLLQDARVCQPDALALNYVAAMRAEGERVYLREVITGEEIAIRPQVVLNASGAWIDFANEQLGENTRYIGGTKGSHLVLRHDALLGALQGEMIYFEYADGRILLCYPLAERVLVGTTDIRISQPNEAVCSDEEAEYLLGALRWLFPKLTFATDDIVFRYCGVRPLPVAAGREGGISRDHSLRVMAPTAERPFPIASLIGGKWTNFRAFSEEAARWALAQLGQAHRGSSACVAIGGGRDFPAGAAAREDWVAQLAAETGHDAAWLARWLERYGARAAEFARAITPTDASPLSDASAYAHGEIALLARQDRVCRLDDLLLRRTLLAFRGEITAGLLSETARIAGASLGWDAPRMESEIARTEEILRERHGIDL